MATWLNDVHAKLNRTAVRQVVCVRSGEDVAGALARARESRSRIIAAGGRHAMGGQQFATDGVVLDTRSMNRVLGFDRVRGLVKMEAGIQWPALIDYLVAAQAGAADAWGIRQKQTGADRFTVGGSLSANIHGRGLTLAPFIGDVEEFEIVLADGRRLTASRTVNQELFRLVGGGYGLFGVIATVTLRLGRRRKIKRIVELVDLDDLTALMARRVDDGFLYGDFQFSCDEKSEDFLRRGVVSCYRPVADETPVPEDQRQLGAGDWQALLHLAHTKKAEAFRRYAAYYLATSGQLYHSDTHQLSFYLDDYHPALDAACCAKVPGTEVIGELYVPPASLKAFLMDVRQDFRAQGVNLIYGTVRWIKKDVDSFLPWAREDYACVVFNIHTDHTPAGIERTREAFVRLIDRAILSRGSYYLTYHRWARPDQVAACYPDMDRFLAKKLVYDPTALLVSDWYAAISQAR